MPDRITVLRHSRNLMAKTWRADGTVKPYDDAKYFRMQTHQLVDIGALSMLLQGLETEPQACVIRGAYVGDTAAAQRDPSDFKPGLVRRALDYFDDQPLHTLLVDVDGFVPLASDPVLDPVSAIDEFVSTSLPPVFHGVAFHWQLSNSAGHPDAAGKLKAHVWFWLATPYTSSQLKAWAEAFKVPLDRAVLNPVQVHYTAAPVFEAGVVDPVPVRSGFAPGLVDDAVALVIDESKFPAVETKGGRGQRLRDLQSVDPVAQKLNELGLVKSVRRDGGLNIECPFVDEHTGGSGETSTTYFPPHTGGHAQGNFKCLHAHCASRTRSAFLLKVGIDEIAEDFDVVADAGGAVLSDFYAHMESHQYLYVPTRVLWPAASVNGRCPPVDVNGKKQPATAWLDKNRPVEQLVWNPGEPELIRDRHLQVSGWTHHNGAAVFNLYRSPAVSHGDARKAGMWLNHVKFLYPDHWSHIVNWLAHRVQQPGVKCNHALVLGGPQGVGKDTLLEPIKAAVGPWNWSDINPVQMLGRFNGWVKAVVVRVNEARDLGDVDRFAFYDHSKVYIAAPPDVLRVDEKHLRETYVANVCGLVITTNHATDGLYLPADDRRHYVAWSPRGKDDFADGYWLRFYAWLAAGGTSDVVAYLREVDLTYFDAKAPPPQTAAFWNIVAAGESPESGELRDVIEHMGSPGAVTLDQLAEQASELHLTGLASELLDRKNRRALPHKLERVRYVSVRNPDATDGLFRIRGKRTVAYASSNLQLSAQITAARALANQ